MPKIPNVYIKDLDRDDDDRDDNYNEYTIAFAFLGFKPWNKMFSVLSRCNPDSNLFCRPSNFKKWDIVAAGELLLESDCSLWASGPIWEDPSDRGPVYYPCSTRVAHAFKRQGYGDLLYKTMLFAAMAHAKKMKFKKWYFGPHVAAGGSTSPSALHVYKSLLRKGYLKKTKWDNVYTVNKLPKNFKPIFY